jgi:hypothetical protein
MATTKNGSWFSLAKEPNYNNNLKKMNRTIMIYVKLNWTYSSANQFLILSLTKLLIIGSILKFMQ